MGGKRVVIIGAGLSGLASAIRLKKKGFDVTVFESQSKAGGKVGEIKLDGYRFDTGPTYITLPIHLERLFVDAGYKLSDFLQIEKLDVVERYFFSDGVVVNAWTEPEKFAYEARIKTGEPEDNVLAQLKKCGSYYQPVSKQLENAENNFSFGSFSKIMNGGGLGGFRNTHSANEKAFKNRKIQMIFDNYATLSGSNPYKMPSSLNFGPYIEHNLGTYYVKGGLWRIITALVQVCDTLGVAIQYNSPVDSIETVNGYAKGVIIGGKSIDADIVISNVDINTTYTKLLPSTRYKVEPEDLSSSAIVFYWGIKKPVPQVGAHNVFFSRYYHEEFDAIATGSIFHDNTVYLNVTSKHEPGDAPAGCENWQAMINAPCNRGQDWNKIINQAREQVLGKIALVINENVQGIIACEEVLTPPLIEARTGAYGGAIFGNSQNSMGAGPAHNPNASSKIKSLFFCGGTVNPGGGIPFSLASAKAVCDLIG